MRVPYSIWFVTTSLVMGGAETMLYRLLSRLDRSQFAPQVVCLTEPGPIGDRIRELEIRVHSLRMHPSTPNPLAVARLAAWLRRDSPAVMQTWMYHADLIGGLTAKLAGHLPVIWGIRQSDLSAEGNRWMTLQTIRACARFSRWLPTSIVCSSEAARRSHTTVGYDASRMVTIRNGLDSSLFRPDADARLSVRQELKIPAEAPLVGIIGRFHPQKDHRNFISAAAHLHAHRPEVYFLLCGDDLTWENPQVSGWIDAAGLRDRCRLVGRRFDMPRLTAALDLAVSASFGESFPNVVAEAMSCGVPCVVTDVGDSAFIVGDTGRVVPARDPEALAGACLEILSLPAEGRRQLGTAARARIRAHFDLGAMVAQYERLYLSTLSNGLIREATA